MEDIASMKVTDLKKELKSRGLTTTGNKTELIERLQLAMMSSSEATEESPEEDLLKDEEELLKEGSAGAATATTAATGADGQAKKKVAIKRDVELPVSTPEEKEKENIASGAPAPKKNLITSPEADKKAAAAVKTDAEDVKGEKEKSEVDGKNDSNGSATADIDKAKARAERFGISTLSDTTKKLSRAERFGLPVGTAAADKEGGDGSGKKSASKIGTAPSVDLETLKKRAERFGNSSSNALKQAEIDEKIKKRQERFGVVEKVEKSGAKNKVVWNAGTNSVVLDEKLKKRAERFGAK